MGLSKFNYSDLHHKVITIINISCIQTNLVNYLIWMIHYAK